MNIKEFKIGAVITRNEPITYEHSGSKDGSYLGNKLVLEGHDPISKIIFLRHCDGLFFKDSITDLSYGRDRWDEGWCLYPEDLHQEIMTRNSLINK